MVEAGGIERLFASRDPTVVPRIHAGLRDRVVQEPNETAPTFPAHAMERFGRSAADGDVIGVTGDAVGYRT